MGLSQSLPTEGSASWASAGRTGEGGNDIEMIGGQWLVPSCPFVETLINLCKIISKPPLVPAIIFLSELTMIILTIVTGVEQRDLD